jgi:hypothetical protein
MGLRTLEAAGRESRGIMRCCSVARKERGRGRRPCSRTSVFKVCAGSGSRRGRFLSRAGEVSRGSRSRAGRFSLCRGDKLEISWSLEAVVSRRRSRLKLRSRCTIGGGEAPVALNLQVVEVHA